MFRDWLHTTLTRMHPGHLFDVLVPPDAAMGDYSVNLAFVLAKKEKKNPREVAQSLCDALAKEGEEMIERCEVAGPGFVNIYLKNSYLRAQLGTETIPNVGNGAKVIVEYSAPNIAKPMHVGHFRSTIIGDALARVYRALGYDVVRWNYLGDWGTQFGKLIAAFRKWGNQDELDADPIGTMLKLYVQFHDELKTDPTLEALGQDEFRKLENGDAENRALWKSFRDHSLKEFQRMYATLGVEFDVYKAESDYEAALPGVIAQLQDKGLASESQGALVVNLDQFGLPVALVRKTDGATLYITRDIASLEDRIATYAPNKILYVVANQQSLHFEQLFAIAQLLKLGPTQLSHVKFGMVLGEDGKKLATREGKTVALQDVVDEITKRAADIVRAKNGELSDEQAAEIARTVGIGALKYNDLRQHPYSDITFDWDAMLDLGGNSGPYLQYTYARLASVVAKATGAGEADMERLVHPTERALMRHLLDFGEAVAACARLHTLNGLALYLYELANGSNRFYELVRINDDDDAARKAARLTLVSAVMRTLKQGLDLLGIKTLERI
jgi:arginyl-tRNA synthetase